MVYPDEEISDTDSEPSSPVHLPCAPFLEHGKDGEKRQYHNVLEQRRRNVLKNSFYMLMSAIPSITKKKLLASRAKVLKRAIKYIHRAEQKRPSRLQDIRNLESDNALLERHCKALEEADKTGDMSNVDAIFKSIDELKRRVYDDELSDTDDDDEDDAVDGHAEPRMDWSSDDDYENNEPEQDDYENDEPEQDDYENDEPEQDDYENDEPEQDDYENNEPEQDDYENNEPEQEEEEPSDSEDDDESTDNADNELVVPRMNWSFNYNYENNEPEQFWSFNAYEGSDSSNSDASSEDSSSDKE